MAKSNQIKAVKNWHESLSDFMIKHPQAKAHDAAKFFGVTESWLSLVKNSDAFKNYHWNKRKEHFSRMSNDIIQKTEVLGELVIDECIDQVEEKRFERLEGRGTGMDLDTLNTIGKLALSALGMTGNSKNAVNVNVSGKDAQVVVNSSEALERAREKMKALRVQNDQSIIEGCVSG